MQTILNVNAKNPYKYNRYWYDELDDIVIYSLLNKNRVDRNKKYNNKHKMRRLKRYRIGYGYNALTYYDIECGFDIETYTDQIKEKATMYIWQFGLNGNVILGRTWEQFVELLDRIKKIIKPSINQRMIIFDFNLGYEFQFVRNWLNIDDSELNFFKEQRKPLFFTHDHFFVFQDLQAMNSSSLKKLAEDYTNTQKCVGDLDYNIARNRLSKLDETSLQYCDNDVLIICEYARYYFDTFLSKGKKPLTGTGVLADEIKMEMDEWIKENNLNPEKWKKQLLAMKPQTKDEYDILMNFIYRGGYTHSNEFYIGELFNEYDNIYGFDFTSSYPASMFLCYFPISKWKYVKCKKMDDLKKLCKKYCVNMYISLFNVKSTTDQTLESKSKCVKLLKPKIDNGRVRNAKVMSVCLTELDFESYLEFYEWEFAFIHWVKIAKRGDILPYLLKPMLRYYVKKDILKKAGKPYGIEKSRANTFYGLSCKRYNYDMDIYENGEWGIKDGQTYEKQNAKNVLTPYIGVYISAHSRRNLLKVAYKLEKSGHSVLYMDTDSLKILNYDNICAKIINDYNDDIDERLNVKCKQYNINRENVKDLGMFDLEYNKIIRFKTMGAKRYILSYVGKDGELHHNQTIAGLPKNELFKHYDWEDVYNIFENDMVVECCKLTSKYIDEPTTLDVDGVIQTELSSIALINSDFTMTLNELWIRDFIEYQKTRKGEKRI